MDSLTGVLKKLPSVLKIFNVKYVVVGLCLSTAFFALDSHVKGLKIDNLTEKISSNERQYRLAASEARRIATEDKAKIERKQLDAKIKADNDYRSLRAKYDAAVVRFKAAGTARRPNLPRETPSPGVPEGTSEGAFFLVPGLDLEICAENTAKAQIAQEWVNK